MLRIRNTGCRVSELHFVKRDKGASLTAVLRIRIRTHRIHVFLYLRDPDPDPLVRGMDPDPYTIKQKIKISTVLWLLFDFLPLKIQHIILVINFLYSFLRKYLQKVICRKTFFLISFLWASWRSMMKIEGSGSISQRHGSPDPDPHQNVMNPQHCLTE